MEIWASIPGWGEWYEVSTMGRVRSLDRTIEAATPFGQIGTRRYTGKLLKTSPASRYPTVSLSAPGIRRCVAVHQIVALVFIGAKPEGLEVCHNDGDPKNNCLSNLRYDTRSANALDRHKHGTMSSTAGVEHHNAKLSLGDLEYIHRNKNTMSHRAIARQLGVGHSTVGAVVRHERYKK